MATRREVLKALLITPFIPRIGWAEPIPDTVNVDSCEITLNAPGLYQIACGAGVDVQSFAPDYPNKGHINMVLIRAEAGDTISVKSGKFYINKVEEDAEAQD